MHKFRLEPLIEVEEGGSQGARRRLLRAAAAAPFVASIPSGAAHAMASASQCVIDSKKASDDGVPILSQSGKDRWVRRVVKLRRFGSLRSGTPETLDAWNIDGTWYDKDGNVVSGDVPDPCDFFTQFCPVGEERDAWVLQIFEPDGTATGSIEAPNGVHRVGTYPAYSIQFDRPAAAPENMGITGTCLCSVDPQYGGSEYC